MTDQAVADLKAALSWHPGNGSWFLTHHGDWTLIAYESGAWVARSATTTRGQASDLEAAKSATISTMLGTETRA